MHLFRGAVYVLICCANLAALIALAMQVPGLEYAILPALLVVIFLLYRHSQGRVQRTQVGALNEQVRAATTGAELMQAWAKMAATLLGEFQRTGPLAYTRDSIILIDDLLDQPAFRAQLADEEVRIKVTGFIGAFVGETLRLRHGGAWIADPDCLYLLEISERLTANPLAKAMKRVANGPEESLDSFCCATAALLARHQAEASAAGPVAAP